MPKELGVCVEANGKPLSGEGQKGSRMVKVKKDILLWWRLEETFELSWHKFKEEFV